MFKNVKVIGDNIKPEVYTNRDPNVPRGHKDYIMSRGELHDFSTNPQKWLLGKPREDTKSTDWGTLMDVLVLTPDEFKKQFAVAPETYESKGMQCPYCKKIADSKKCKACGGAERVEVAVEKPWNTNATVCSDWEEAQVKAGFKVVKKKDVDEAYKALKILNQDDQIVELIKCSQKQMMIIGVWVDRETGIEVPVKILLDLVPDKSNPRFCKSLSDFKTARNAETHAWDNAVAEHWYDAQAALYMDLYTAAFPDEERIEWRHAIQENEEPYVTARRLLSEQFIEVGRGKYRSALRDYCVCLATGNWPGYDDHGWSGKGGWTLTEPKDWMVNAAFGLGLALPKKVEPEKEASFDTN